MKTRLQNRFTRVDIVAMLAFAAVWIFAIITVRSGFFFADEGSYLSYAQRFLQGDRPIVDEWHVAQFSGLLLCLPYKLFVTLSGGTDGVILFMRYLFLAFNAGCFWFIYVRLREYGWLDLIAALLFCSFIPYGIVTCSYYTIAIRLLMIVCLILYSEKQKVFSLLAAGFLFACAVIMQPGFVFLYLVYSVLILIRFVRRKKNKRFLDSFAFCLHGRAWLYISLGAVPVAAVFLAWLLGRSDLHSIVTAVPGIFSNPEYNYASILSTKGIFLRRIFKTIRFYGLPVILLALAVFALSIVCACGVFRKRRNTIRKLLFTAACVLWIFCCVRSFWIEESTTMDTYFFVYPAPLFLFGMVCFLLGDRKNSRLLYFWVVGLCASACVDFLSDVTLLFCASIATIADLVFIRDLVRELRADPPALTSAGPVLLREQKSARLLVPVMRWLPRLACLCLAAWFSFITLVLDNASFPEYFLYGTSLFSSPYVCEKGPLRALRCTQIIGEDYDNQLADIDAIKAKDPKNLYICGLKPELYLYADLPYATYSAFAWRSDAELARHIRYWTLYPERRPDWIYIPVDSSYNPTVAIDSEDTDFDAWIRQTFDPLCAYTQAQGKCGYILHVSKWTLPA